MLPNTNTLLPRSSSAVLCARSVVAVLSRCRSPCRPAPADCSSSLLLPDNPLWWQTVVRFTSSLWLDAGVVYGAICHKYPVDRSASREGSPKMRFLVKGSIYLCNCLEIACLPPWFGRKSKHWVIYSVCEATENHYSYIYTHTFMAGSNVNGTAPNGNLAVSSELIYFSLCVKLSFFFFIV